MLSDFPQKKETFFDLKNRILKVQKTAFFQGITHAFGEKCQLFGLFRFG